MSSSRYYTNSSQDKYSSDNLEDSTSHKLKNAYWTTKQVVIKKLGRKEDEHVVAGDSELDAKLELFRSIQRTCLDLTRVIDRYQDKICMLSQAENELGRFLKNHGSEDKTRAGKMMIAVGKSLSFSAQQRLALRVPLSRLYQEVDTFRYRAISDTLLTVEKMENKRTEYRAALLWMKDISENLDPDTFKQLDKFRKVQTQVRSTKSKFDKMKLDSMQKVDLLAASRCNMFSHVLSLYQNTLLQFWEKTCRTMVAVADSFKGYQYYEFSMLKDLTDESKKLAELSRRQDDEDNDTIDEARRQEADDFEQLNRKLDEIFTGVGLDTDQDNTDREIARAIESNKYQQQQNSSKKVSATGGAGCGNMDASSLLMDQEDVVDEDQQKEEQDLLDELLKPSSKPPTESLRNMFDEFLGQSDEEPSSNLALGQLDWSNQIAKNTTNEGLAGVMPSALLDLRSNNCGSSNSTSSAATHKIQKSSDAQQWLNMFADLDPLANPDSLSKKEGQITDT